LDRPLRIAFVAYRGNMQCGGQGVYLWFLTRELSRLGHSVEVFVGPPYPDPMPWAERVGFLPNRQHWGKWFTRDYAGMLPEEPLGALAPLNLYELGASRLGFLPEPFAFSVRALGAAARRLREGARWDLVHDVQCLGYGLLGLRALGLPVVSTVHHPLSVDRRASFVRDTNFAETLGTMKFYPVGMQSFVARRIDRVLTSSLESARTIARDFGVSPARIVNVWNGLDTDLFSPDPETPRSTAELVCVGRSSDPNKGIRSLIQAMSQLPESVQLTLVDSANPGNPVFKWAREAGVADRLHVTGRISTDELVRLYRRATLVVVPSRYEGFGLPAVEAMACGTPVVVSAAGALPEVMRMTGGGVLVAPDRPRSLAAGVRRLLDQSEMRGRLGREARLRVVRCFGWRPVAEATVNAYREILAERRARRAGVGRTYAIARGRPASTTTSDSEGARRASASRARSSGEQSAPGIRATTFDHPGMPQPSEIP